MRSRCLNPKSASFEHYGARGITICPEWADDFDRFVADMGEAPEGLSLERDDNALGYSKANCRWATMTDQLNNQRRNVKLTYQGRTRTLGQWAAEIGIRYDTLHRRFERGLPAEKILAPGKLTVKPLVHGTRSGYERHQCRCAQCREFNAWRAREARR